MEHITTEAFETEVLKAEKPVVVDFWAVWCGPCRMMAPVLEQLEKERPELKVCKVDVDDEPQLAMRYQVSSIPTILLFRDGKVAGKAVGYMPKEALCAQLGLA